MWRVAKRGSTVVGNKHIILHDSNKPPPLIALRSYRMSDHDEDVSLPLNAGSTWRRGGMGFPLYNVVSIAVTDSLDRRLVYGGPDVVTADLELAEIDDLPELQRVTTDNSVTLMVLTGECITRRAGETATAVAVRYAILFNFPPHITGMQVTSRGRTGIGIVVTLREGCVLAK